MPPRHFGQCARHLNPNWSPIHERKGQLAANFLSSSAAKYCVPSIEVALTLDRIGARLYWLQARGLRLLLVPPFWVGNLGENLGEHDYR